MIRSGTTIHLSAKKLKCHFHFHVSILDSFSDSSIEYSKNYKQRHVYREIKCIPNTKKNNKYC